MAEVRKSAKQTAARQRAREKAAEFREKHDTLEQLATDYFEVADSIDDVEAKVAKEIAAARDRADKLITQGRAKSDAVIAKMLDLGTPRDEVAGRLGISTRDVKRNTPNPKAAATASQETPAPSPEGPDETGDARTDVTMSA
ncbi:hypothetical protein AX769_22185 (plasmid) [Frondihabitans sp. PAMC 28766]|uniref:hypothetical protein n=1 Tax=Frondihabitans sp. PAMC 28766 TaxID=1795630 RepID=UPI00078B4292|nr:hypothetical protein [Frondihabitans sp. PAMC 28766]AMM22842.1 hypothetical protein AX769_22185 [Frondihabitans sp. PAMC 28766]